MHSPRARVTLAASSAVALAASLVAAAGPAQAVSSTAVISEAYGGGGNSGAMYTNDFVELQGVAASTSLDGDSVQYLPGAPSSASTWQVTNLSGSVAAGGYYLVQESQGSAGNTPLPTPDASGNIFMSATSGTVALVQGTAALTCKTTADCSADPRIVDLVGYGSGSTTVHEGGGNASGASNTLSVQRDAAGDDTDDNAADFTAAAPTPKSAPTGGGNACTPPATTNTIDAIQGDDFQSGDVGNTETAAGVVTATNSGGYWLQQVSGIDADPATSEGIYVYTGSAAKPTVGDSVVTTATVSEYDPQAAHSTTSNLTITELDSATTCVVSQGNPLPAPVVIGPDSVPADYAFDNGGNSIDTLPIVPTRSALDYYESLEGMRVEVDNVRVVGPTDAYGEQYITTKPDQAETYRGGTELLGENQTPSGRLELVPLTSPDLGVDVGDEIQGATVGPLDYSQYGGYVLRASSVGTVVHNGLAPVVAQPAAAGQMSIATYNVENLSIKDPVSKFVALASGIVTNLASPDVVALEEIQDNSGSADDGTVAANLTLHKLIAKIVQAGGPRYRYRQIDPVNDQDGGQPGGNIRVAFLYDPTRVSFVGAGPGKNAKHPVDRSTVGTQVTDDDGTPGLTLSPGRIDPTNPAWASSRKPLVGEFRFNGQDVFVIANHFVAKLGDQNADGRFQYPAQSSAVQRQQQATLVHDFVQQLLDVDAQAKVVVVGDLNDYQFSPALATLKTGTPDGSGPPILTDLIATLPTDQQYTYVYEGVSEVLDHILATSAVTDQPFDYQVVHVNSEYHDQVSDHDPQVLDLTP